MIIVEGRFELPGLSDVWIYPDDQTESGFYAIPAHPRVAVDSQGKPEISLVLYGRGKASNFEATGGIFTLTVCLGLSSEQEKTVISLLARRLSSTGRPQLLSPDWQQGEVELQLDRDLTVAGETSRSLETTAVHSTSNSAPSRPKVSEKPGGRDFRTAWLFTM